MELEVRTVKNECKMGKNLKTWIIANPCNAVLCPSPFMHPTQWQEKINVCIGILGIRVIERKFFEDTPRYLSGISKGRPYNYTYKLIFWFSYFKYTTFVFMVSTGWTITAFQSSCKRIFKYTIPEWMAMSIRCVGVAGASPNVTSFDFFSRSHLKN